MLSVLFVGNLSFLKLAVVAGKLCHHLSFTVLSQSKSMIYKSSMGESFKYRCMMKLKLFWLNPILLCWLFFLFFFHSAAFILYLPSIYWSTAPQYWLGHESPYEYPRGGHFSVTALHQRLNICHQYSQWTLIPETSYEQSASSQDGALKNTSSAKVLWPHGGWFYWQHHSLRQNHKRNIPSTLYSYSEFHSSDGRRIKFDSNILQRHGPCNGPHMDHVMVHMWAMQWSISNHLEKINSVLFQNGQLLDQSLVQLAYLWGWVSSRADQVEALWSR